MKIKPTNMPPLTGLTILCLTLLMAACQTSTTPKALPPPSKNTIANTNRIPGGIDFQGVSAEVVLILYRRMMDVEMDTQLPQEALTARISLLADYVSPSQAAQVIETALREQAGIVVTRIDEKHLKVRFDNTAKRKQQK